MCKTYNLRQNAEILFNANIQIKYNLSANEENSKLLLHKRRKNEVYSFKPLHDTKKKID